MYRETLEDGSLRISTDTCAFVIKKLRAGVLLVLASGDDDGSLGEAVLDELAAELARHGSLQLFIDATATAGVTTVVRETWTRWIEGRRDKARIMLLVGSKFMTVTLNVAKHLAGAGKMVVLSDRKKFDAAVAVAAGKEA